MSLTRTETKNVRALQTRKGRRASGRFVAEGVRLLEEALRFGARPNALYYSEALLSDRGLDLVTEFRRRGTDAQPVKAADLGRMAGAETSQGLLAVFDTPSRDLAELHRPSVRKVLVCEKMSDPGNVGTLIRSAAAFDFDMVILCEPCAEPFSPKVVRSSVGAVFAVPIAVADTAATLAYLKRERAVLLAAGLDGRADVTETLTRAKTGRYALAIGSEADGLSPALLEAADSVVRIPHSRKVESLNSAVAGSILMRECYDSEVRRKR